MVEKCKLEDMPDIVSIYHEILINEIALMRSNAIVEEGVDTGDAIVYYSTLTSHNPRADRGLDYMILAYSIINGFRRLECGYNILSPMDIRDPSECESRGITERMRKALGTWENLHIGRRDGDSLEELVAKVAMRMMECGLIHVMFKDNTTTDDTVSPLQAYKLYTPDPRLQDQPLEVRDLRGFYSYRLYYRMREFFEKLGVNLDKLIGRFKELFESYTGVNVDMDRLYFKTLHGILFKYASHASSLPTRPAVLEANILPFIIEPAPFHRRGPDGVSLKQQFEKLAEKATGCVRKDVLAVIGEALGEVLNGPLTDFQYEYLQEMFAKCSEEGGILTVITSPAGTGKTHIFFTYTLAKLLAAKQANKRAKALIIYPRKALARDQLGKMIELLSKVNEKLEDERLKLKVGIYDGDSLTKSKDAPQVQELRGLKIGGYRVCHGFSSNGYEVFLIKSGDCKSEDRIQIDWIMDLKDIKRVFDEADIVITNHSMLTKLVNENFMPNATSSFRRFLEDLKVLVVDEAHMYLGEELEILATTLLKLFYLTLTLKGKLPQNLTELAENLNMNIIFSSATLTDHNMITRSGEEGEQRLDSRSIVGFFKVKTRRQVDRIPENLENFLKALLSEPVYNRFHRDDKLVYKDYDSMVSEDVKNYRWKGPFRVKIALVAHPYPKRESWTSLAEILISTLHWLNATRLRLSENAQALVFIDTKESLKNIFKLFLERQILEAQDHVDRVLLTGLYKKKGGLHGKGERSGAIKAIIEAINELARDGSKVNLMKILYHDEVLGNFHALHPYITIQDLNKLTSNISSYDDFVKVLEKFKLYGRLNEFLESLNNYAKLALDTFEGKGWNGYRELLENLGSPTGGYPSVILVHHGDLGARERALIESHMKGDKKPTPLVTIATSTLEVGVDVESISLIIQYASYPQSADLMQRFGRSGRHTSSFYVSTLILVLRNTGEDVRLVRDADAVEYVYNFRLPQVANVLRDADAVVRSLTPILLRNRGALNKVEEFLKKFLNMLQQSWGGEYIDGLVNWKLYIESIESVGPPGHRDVNLPNELMRAEDTLYQIGQILTRLEKYDLRNEMGDLRSKIRDLREELMAVRDLINSLVDPQLNLIPIIVRLVDLEKRLGDFWVRRIAGKYPEGNALRELLKELHGIIFSLVSYAHNRLNNWLNKPDDTLKYIASHVPPGATEEMGSMSVVHFLYPVDDRKVMKEEAWEAFMKMRPLRTGF